MKISDLWEIEFFLAFMILITICFIILIIADYFEYKIMKEQSDELRKNINNYVNTRVGALENDRINERQKKK
tara:strand:- start:293 stop:508 length:216 start_codon:yes stop_codon:yes gene_type:complete